MIDKSGFHFTYDGENSKSHKLVVTGVDDYALPQKKVITYDIDGRDGSLLYDTKAFENTPYNITGPAIVKILQPIPNTCPSFLNSIAADAIALANPVIGTKVPAPA